MQRSPSECVFDNSKTAFGFTNFCPKFLYFRHGQAPIIGNDNRVAIVQPLHIFFYKFFFFFA